jgi:hypothetical protein
MKESRMRYLWKFGILAALPLLISACAAHGPGDIAYDAHSGGTQATGATTSGASGAVSGGTNEDTAKDKRGNTPPGVDRDGHGPAAGAIIDPTGAVTGRKP